MDTRNFVLFVVALAIGGAIVFSGSYAKSEAARADLAEAKEELQELEEDLGAAAEDTGDVAKVDQLAANYETLEVHKKMLVESVIDLEAKRENGLQAFREAVESVRSKSVGAPWADVPFRNGQMLRGVRIQKISETEVTFAHSEGVARLKTDELPPDLKERFRLGMEPFLAASVSSTPTSVPVAASTPRSGSTRTGSSTKNPVSSASLTDVATNAAKAVATLEEQFTESTAKINTAQTSMRQWRNKAAEFQGQAASAKVSGRPTYNLLKEASEAERQANSLEIQLNSMRAEHSLLRQRLSTARVDAMRAQGAANRQR